MVAHAYAWIVLTVSATGLMITWICEYPPRVPRMNWPLNGVQYEEHDRKADPVTATLIISVAVSTLVAAPLTE